MHYNFKHGQNRPIYHLNSFNLSIQRLFFQFSLFIRENLRTLRRSLRSAFQCLFRGSKLSRQIFLVLMVVTFHPFPGHALTSTTSNVVHGNVPYLTFDGGRTRAINTDGLLGITLSNGMRYTPSTNNSSNIPIVLPIVGQSFADISMFVPTNTNSVALSTVIGWPYNYWGDDDGDGNISATGSLNLSIFDKNDQPVSRYTVLDICNAPYRIVLNNTFSTLSSRYGVPNSRFYGAGNVTYYVKPNLPPAICFVKPNVVHERREYNGPDWLWDSNKGFRIQSTSPSSYNLNFPTTGAHGFYFDLDIGGVGPLSWAPVSREGITANMYYLNNTTLRVTLTGPVIPPSQWHSKNPNRIAKPTLPQTFELIGRDSRGNEVVKYGFVLNKWFVNNGDGINKLDELSALCKKIGGYKVVTVRDLTNANFDGLGATPSSSGNHFQRRIGAGLLSEWGTVYLYSGANFYNDWYVTRNKLGSNSIVVHLGTGLAKVARMYDTKAGMLCVVP